MDDIHDMIGGQEETMVAFAERDYAAEVRCRYCGTSYSIMYNRRDMIEWMNGRGYIQDLLSYLSPAERELLISGTCGKCFDMMFPPIDSDDEE